MTDKSLITNQDISLEDVIKNILPNCKNLFFLVGYFYFSGFRALYENLGDKNLKILVGMDIDVVIQNKIKEFNLIEAVNTATPSIIASRKKYYESLRSLFNDTDFFESEEKQEAFKIYIEKIKDHSLEVRKTRSPNHAKLYLFENLPPYSQGGFLPGTVITGSSNLSLDGLKGRFEVNVVLHDKRDYNEARELFDTLWKDSDITLDSNCLPDFQEHVSSKIWFDRLFNPFYMYIRVLDEFFSRKKTRRLRFSSEISNNRYMNLEYQKDAVENTIAIIEKHGGVIISDVVGLGKSIVASTAAWNIDLKTIVIAPPHLKEQWQSYLWEFDVTARVYSSGKIDAAVLENHDDEEKLIIIDEAHKYRNENTKTYADLHRLCQGNKVILLTATPFNNSPADIFAMIKLFQVPAKPSLQVAENLSHEFKRLIEEYKNIKDCRKKQLQPPEVIEHRIKKVADDIRRILFPLIIRRTRLDLKAIDKYREDLEIQGFAFPKVEDPIDMTYNLGDLSALYRNTLDIIAPSSKDKANGKTGAKQKQRGFTGARYKPVDFLKDIKKYKEQIDNEFGSETLFRQSQVNIADFMKRLLVSRFESSIAAFKKTLEYMIASSHIMLKWLDDVKQVPIFKKGYIPDPDDILDLDDDALPEEMRELVFAQKAQDLRDKGYEFIPAHELKVDFKKEILKDIELLEGLREQWFANGIEKDPKLDCFKTIMRDMLEKEPARKLVVFSEYAETANYLHEQLKDSFRVFKYTASDSSKENKRAIKENFDASCQTQKNDYDILIATDAISEGYNLHRAGAVFNYDIPFNPTRVIQRVGRINRIDKKVFDTLYIYNFFPTAIGERETHRKQISTLKIAVIGALLGEDTRVLTPDEQLESFFTDTIKKGMMEQDELSWESEHINLLENLKKTGSDILSKAREIPRRARIRRSEPKDASGVLVFGKKGNEYVFKRGLDQTAFETLSPETAIELFKADAVEKAQQVSAAFNPIYENVKKNLFTAKETLSAPKARNEAVNKLNLLKNLLPGKEEYITDLVKVIEKLDALPEYYLRLIRGVSAKYMEKEFRELEQAIPHSYLEDIIKKSENVEKGEESLILSEELI